MTYCSKCGEEISEEDDFCPSCGAELEEGVEKSNGGTDKGFWTGIIGGILGFLAGVLAYLLGGIKEAVGSGAGDLYIQAAFAVIFSMVGLLSGTAINRKKLAGGLMIFSGIVVFFAVSLFGVLTFILFLVGGIRILRS